MVLVKRTALWLVALGFLASAPALAQQPASGEYPGLETGKMWTFDVPPVEYWARRYNFRPSQEWLDHARLSAARLPGCTASFVSADGLVMTNHHCARGCVEGVTRQGEDFLTNGFYAKTRAEERACPGNYVDQLLEISDVTQQVTSAIPDGTPAQRAADLRSEAVRGIERTCRGTATDLNCQVIAMYAGGQYKLYKFHRYTDVRLVMAVEASTAFFGGDPDNFTYPRYDVDMSFFRVYVNGQPAHMEHFYRWSANGSRDGDLVFVVGNPGSTGRLSTMAQLEYLRDTQYPASMDQLHRQIAVYHQLSDLTPERASANRNTIFGLENSQKAITGYQSGLLDDSLMNHKRAWERDFRARVNANADLRSRYGAAWDNIARGRREMATLDVRRRYYAFGGLGTRLLNYAGAIARYATEMAKPDSARLMPFRDAMRPRMEAGLYGNNPVDTTAEIRLLAAYFSAMARELPATDPVRRQALGTRTPEDAARAMVQASQILTGDQRRALVQGGAAAVAASTDPFVRSRPGHRPAGAADRHAVDATGERGDLEQRAGGPRAAGGLRQHRGAGRDLQPPHLRRRGPRLSVQRHGGPAVHDPLRHVRPLGRDGWPGALRPHAEVARGAGAARPLHAARRGLHERHHRRELRQPGHQSGRRSRRPHLRRQHREPAVAVPLHGAREPLGMGGFARDHREPAARIRRRGARERDDAGQLAAGVPSGAARPGSRTPGVGPCRVRRQAPSGRGPAAAGLPPVAYPGA